MKALTLLFCFFFLSGCSHREAPDEIRVGTIAGPETTLMQVAKKVAFKRYGLRIKIITFSDFILPNQALEDGQIDANAFQHLPYLTAQNKLRGFNIKAVAKTFLYPMGIYSNKIKSLAKLKVDSTIALPSDPSNETRALLLLQQAGLIALDNQKVALTPANIIANPKQLQFITLDAADLSRTLNDVAAAIINTNYASVAGLHLKQALFVEGPQSPYTNIIATTPNKIHSKKIQHLILAFQSKPVLAEAHKLFKGSAIPGWKVNKTD